MIDRDPPRLLESARDARVHEALSAARARTPSALQLESLAAKVGSAAHAASGAGGLGELLGHASGMKLSIALVALGTALWAAWPAPSEPERVERAAPAAIEPALRVEPARATEAAHVAPARAAPASPVEAAQPALAPELEPTQRPSETGNARDEEPARARSARPGRVRPRARDAAPARGPSVAHTSAPAAEPELPATTADDAPGELELLGRAQAALGRDAGAALELLEEHRDAFPRGAFSEEREALAIDALRRLGRRAALQARARAFLSAYPSSPHADRIGRWLE